MGYQNWWKILESLIAELRRKRVEISSDVMTSLRSAKTMISVYIADSSRSESIPTIEEYLLNVESYVITLAEDNFRKEFVDSWARKLDQARKEPDKPIRPLTSRFVHGIPKEKHWIRVLPSNTILEKDVEKLATQSELSWKKQPGGYILLYGSKEKVKDFVRKMAEKCKPTRKS
ncbi:MAG: DUF2096 family protein [Candidatus Bathyarchaeota archaeon]|nr:MAG: DUF2096 family protein [Candidatus Bathyarchaeota archaeon]